MSYAMMFFSNFFVVFLLGLQSRNVNAGRYIPAVIASVGISLANFTFIKFAATGSYVVLAVCTAGGCFGIAFSIWFYQNVMEKRRRQVC